MKLVIQKCLSASCKVDNEIISSVNSGYMILVGVTHNDTTTKAKYLAEKVAKLRIFPDSEGKLNQNIIDNNGEILSISQFTLYGTLKKGNRPSFVEASPREHATLIYEAFNEHLNSLGVKTYSGAFGCHMEISLVNDGPTTIILEE